MLLLVDEPKVIILLNLGRWSWIDCGIVSFDGHLGISSENI